MNILYEYLRQRLQVSKNQLTILNIRKLWQNRLYF